MRNKRRTATANGNEEKEKEKKKKKKKQQLQQNGRNQNAMKSETEEVVVVESSSSDFEEERNEGQEEEAKSSNNSNQNSNLALKEDEEEEEKEAEEEENDIKRKKVLSNGVAVVGCFPTHRLKRMIRSEGDFRTTGEAIFLINKATEKFIESLTEDAYACSVQDRKKSINYKHLSSVVSKTKRFDFLSDFVPEKVSAKDALEERRLAGT